MAIPGVAVLVGLTMASSAAAEAFTMADLHPLVSRTAYAQLVEQLGADRDERGITDMLYADYSTSLEQLAANFDEAERVAGRDQLEDGLAGRVVLDLETLRALRIAVREATAPAFADADHLARVLFEDTEVILGIDAPVFAVAIADLQLDMYLAPRRSREQDPTYAGDGVDLRQLISLATADGAEFAGWNAEDLRPWLDGWGQALRERLITDAEDEESIRRQLAIAMIQRDASSIGRLQREAIRYWKPGYDLSRRTAESIADQARTQLGENAAIRWMSRYHRACFPLLQSGTSPEDQLDWIGRRIEDSTILTEARTIVREHRGKRLVLCETAINLMLRARAEFGIMLHARTRPTSIDDNTTMELYRDLLRNSGELATLDRATSDALERLLTKNQRLQMKADLAARAFGRRR